MLTDIDLFCEFGPYRLDAAKRLLIRSGKSLPIAPKTFDLLLLFIKSQGRVMKKAELMSSLWPDTFVDDTNLAFQISALRKSLGHEGMRWVETVPKHGYRFSAPVSEVNLDHTMRQPAALPDPAVEPKATPLSVGDDLSLQTISFPAHSSGLLAWQLTAAVSILGTLILAVAHFREAPSSRQTIRFLISPSEKVVFQGDVPPAISPGGERVAFVGVERDGRRRIWIRALDSPVAEPLPGTEFVDSAFWSHDGRSIGFFANGKLKTADIRGGAPQTLGDAPGSVGAGSWGRDGVILFQTNARLQLYRVPATGGVPMPATVLDSSRQEVAHYAPQFLPDGRHFIYLVKTRHPDADGIYLGSLDSQVRKHILSSNANAAYAQSADGAGYILFTSGTTLMAQGFDPASGRLSGNPAPIVRTVLVTLATGLHRAAFSASHNGVLAYRAGMDTGSTELVWIDRRGRRLDSVGEVAEYTNPALSPDEKKLLVARMDPQYMNRDLVLFDLVRGISDRLTFDPADESNAVWSPDGNWIAFSSIRNGLFAIYRKQVRSSAKPELLMESDENNFVHSWSADGRFILFRSISGYWMLPLDQEVKAKIALRAGRSELCANAEMSPDGRWVAYQLDESTRSEVYVAGLTPPTREWHVSIAGGIEPRWRRDGRELYYLAGNKLMAVPVKSGANSFEMGTPQTLFDVRVDSLARRSRYQAAASGEKFLVASIDSSSPITVTANWTNLLLMNGVSPDTARR